MKKQTFLLRLALLAITLIIVLAATTALAKIKWCAYAVFAIFVLLLPLFYNWAQAEDAPGLLLLALILTGIALVIGVFASILVQLLTTAIKIKNENELTI